MNERDQIISIAEFCGGDWLYNPKAKTPHRIFVLKDTYISHAHDFEIAPMEIPIRWDLFIQTLPDYTKDLNAIHKALSFLDSDQKQQLVRNIAVKHDCYKDSDDKIPMNTDVLFLVFNSSASEIAEEFLKVVGKWKD